MMKIQDVIDTNYWDTDTATAGGDIRMRSILLISPM